MGANENAITEGEFVKVYSEVESRRREQKALSGEISSILKRAKELGLNKAAMAVAGRAAKLSPSEAIAFLNNIKIYAGFLRVKGAEQLSLIDEFDAAQPPSDADYFDQGYQSFARGEGRDACPHDANSAGGRHWNDGYSQAAKDTNAEKLERGIKPLEPPKKRGRPKKTKVEEQIPEEPGGPDSIPPFDADDEAA